MNIHSFVRCLATTLVCGALVGACSEGESEEGAGETADAGNGGTPAGSSGSPGSDAGAAGDGGRSMAAGAGGVPIAGAAGAGGSSECSFVADCEGLDEPACDDLDHGDSGGCFPRYGEPGVGEVGDMPQYAGCATRCCGTDCELPPDSFACAHPAGTPNECWTLTSAPAPDGWVLLSDFESCSEFVQCSE